MNPQSDCGGTGFLGLRFADLSEEAVLEAVDQLSSRPAFSYVVTPNVDHIVRLYSPQADVQLWQSYRSASLCLCDSRILKALAALTGSKLSLVTGSDLTARLLADPSRPFRDVAVIGGDDELVSELSRRFPAMQWHHHSPPMGVRTNKAARQAVVEFVEDSPANLYLLAIGSPQSELICAELARRTRAHGVALCIGASLEFIVGAKMRAPLWMQKASLEWLFRLCSEPKRLWRRYLIDGPTILRIWWLWHFRGRALPSVEFDSSPPDET